MAENRLNIISIVPSQFEQPPGFSRGARIREMQAKFERLWLLDPERFNPLRNCVQQERLKRTWQLLTKHVDVLNKQAIDIGCGAGVFSRQLRDGGASVTAVDIAENALKRFKEIDAKNIQLKQGGMPSTTLPDHAYDIVICTEVIAELSPEDYRLFFAELSRLIKPDGHLICSSDIDIDSVGGLERLTELAQTEFDLLETVASYHALYIRLKHFFEAPSYFIKGWQESDFRQKELTSRRGLNRGWFWLNTMPPFVWLWNLLNPLTRPILKFLKSNTKCLLRLEKICRLIWDQDGISHYLFIAKRRPLKTVEPEDIPIEKPRRKEVWD